MARRPFLPCAQRWANAVALINEWWAPLAPNDTISTRAMYQLLQYEGHSPTPHVPPAVKTAVQELFAVGAEYTAAFQALRSPTEGELPPVAQTLADLLATLHIGRNVQDHTGLLVWLGKMIAVPHPVPVTRPPGLEFTE